MNADAAVVLKAWQDPSYRDKLPENVRAAIPEPPEGFEGLSDEQLEEAAGGATPAVVGIGLVATAVGGTLALLRMGVESFDDPNGPG